jgi:large repetitive protein
MRAVRVRRASGTACFSFVLVGAMLGFGAVTSSAGDDVTPPETAINAGPEDGATITTDSASFGFASGEPHSTFECQLDDGVFQSCESPRELMPLTNGAHTFHVQATDEAGNTDPTSPSRTFTVNVDGGGDTTPPETEITSGPVAGSTIDDATPTFAFRSNETGSTFECRFDNGGFSACTSPYTHWHLSDGTHTFEVRAIDMAGNIDYPEPADATFAVDAGESGDIARPNTTIEAGPETRVKTKRKKAKVIFEFAASETGATYECNFNDLGWQECWFATQVTAHRGKWHLDVRATDLAGNTDETPAEWNWIVKRKKRKN